MTEVKTTKKRGRPATGQTPPAERKAAERARHKEAGRVAVTVHVWPEFREQIRELEAKLQRKEGKA